MTTEIRPKDIQRAKDLAARDSCQVYMETLQRELRALVTARGDPDPNQLVTLAGVHMHEALVMDQSGHALGLICTWQIVSSPSAVAEILERARHDGVA